MIDDRCHQGRHKFHRIIVFEPGCLISNDSVTGGVRLIKGIFGKIHHSVIDAGSDILIDSAGDTSRDILLGVSVHEVAALLFHDLLLLFAHRAAHQVASAQGVAAQIADDLHNLLLINYTSVCGLQDGLKFRTGVTHLTQVIFALDVLRDKIHGARSVQGDSRYDVLEIPGAELLHKVLHAPRLKLENSVCFAG